MNEKGDFTPPLMNILSGDFDMYHIHPNTPSREWMNAPITSVTFFLQPTDGFESAATELFETMEKKSECRGLTWGEAMRPPRRDPSGWLRDGKGVVLIAGWETPEDLERAMESGDVRRAGENVENMVKKMMRFRIMLRVTEKSQFEHSWRRL